MDLWCCSQYFVSFRTHPNVSGSYDDNLPEGWYDRVFIHYIDDEFLRPDLVATLAPGQSWSASFGLQMRFGAIDRATASAKLTFCAPAPPRIATLKPARLPNGTYPALVLKGGACSAGKTFRNALSLVVSNPSVGCGAPLYIPPASIGDYNAEYQDVESLPG